MLVIKWLDAIKYPRVKVYGPLCGGLKKSCVYSYLVMNKPRRQYELLQLVQRGECLDCPKGSVKLIVQYLESIYSYWSIFLAYPQEEENNREDVLQFSGLCKV